jgi:hypothetical protein
MLLGWTKRIRRTSNTTNVGTVDVANLSVRVKQ